MSTKLHIFKDGSSFIQNDTNYVQYYQGRKYIITRQISSHANGGTYLYRQAMVVRGRGSFLVIPGSGMSRTLSSANTYSGHLSHVQAIRIYNELRFQEFVTAPF